MIVFRTPENRIALKTKTSSNHIGARLNGPGRLPKARFTIFGEEIIEKQVKAGGNAGRIYLPLDWVGKLVKIIRID
ncbi:MAG: DUF2080 family transposase-associated protein [Desulfobacterales bacterium]